MGNRSAALTRTVADAYRARPRLCVAAALFAGFVIGGGLSWRAGRAALGVLARRALKELMSPGGM
jgi:hypothetical protein